MKPSPKQALLGFLNNNVFQPALECHGGDYAASEPKLLRSVLKRVQTTQSRYGTYGTAAEVRDNFFSDLHSEAGKKMSSDMAALRMKTFEEVELGFRNLCQELGV